MQLLLTPPDYFRVARPGQNPYMTGEQAVDPKRARQQWLQLVAHLLEAGAEVHLAKAKPCLPDMVFAANAGAVLPYGGFIPSHYVHASRQGETEAYRREVSRLGFPIRWLGVQPFEGQGDVLDTGHDIWIGYGPRTSQEAAQCFGELAMQQAPKRKAQTLHLVDPYFYHLDTCLRVIREKDACRDWILYFPPAFSPASLAKLHRRYPPRCRVPVTRGEALDFVCNSIDLSNHQILGHRFSSRLQCEFQKRGWRGCETDMSEFLKSGGSVKCCILELS